MHLLLQTSLERVKTTINSRLGVHILYLQQNAYCLQKMYC